MKKNEKGEKIKEPFHANYRTILSPYDGDHTSIRYLPKKVTTDDALAKLFPRI